MRILLGLFLALQSISASAVVCDKANAINQKMRFSKLASSEKEHSHIAVRWTFEIEKLTKEKQLMLVRAFANADACLSNDAREMWFYRNKKLMGIASPDRGIQLMD